MKQQIILSLLVSIFFVGTSCNTGNENSIDLSNNPLIGEWEIKEIHWKTKDTIYSISKAQPGLLIISKNKYSIIWTPTNNARKPFEHLSNPTDNEILEGFKSIVFNAGTYKLTDTRLTTKAEIAKVPGFKGGRQFLSYMVESDLLRLTMYDEIYPDGTKPEWSGKFQTEFVLKKVKLSKISL